MHPQELSIDDFTYDLPQDKIAYFPAEPRDSSKLLVYRAGEITESNYNHIAQFIPTGSLMVFNDTRVVKSRIFFEKDTGAVIEIFCFEPFGAFSDYETVFQGEGSSTWKCMIGKAGKWKEKFLEKEISINGENVLLRASLVEKLSDAYVVKFEWEPKTFSFADIISHAGVTPLPPYIKRKAENRDEQKYQTIYSSHNGSVAAPTAGLHFTEKIFASINLKKIKTAFTTLHVGAGTFKPVKADKMQGHEMHAEWMELSVGFLEELLAHIHQKIICVGTTSMRTVESIYHMGNKLVSYSNLKEEDLKIHQWEVYSHQNFCTPEDSLKALISFIKKKQAPKLFIQTEIIIAPGYKFRLAEGLVTNFHQPKSTLILLVAAFVGNDWRKIYDYALNHHFRFLSYGDGCLLLK